MKIHIPDYEEIEQIGEEIIIHSWDTWNMDYTLAKIILPMLKQLKATNPNKGSNNYRCKWSPRRYRFLADQTFV